MMPPDIFTSSLAFTVSALIKTAFIWAPLLLSMIAWYSWKYYINRLHLSEIKWTMLEVRVPRDVFKSPMAMELVLINALYQTGGVGTWYHKHWLGNVPVYFSLEIVSIEGAVRFFIRTQPKFVSVIESAVYAHYPQAEVNEVEDYTLSVPPHGKDGSWSTFGTEFKLTKSDAVPIKTYVDYGLDKVGLLKDEQQIDPISSTMELLGSMSEGEQFWIQIVVRPANWARYPDPKAEWHEWHKKIKWTDVGKAEIEKMLEKTKGKEGKPGVPLTKTEQDTLAAIEKSITKFGFDAGIRAIYIAKKEQFDASRIAALTGIFRQYNTAELNGFAPCNVTSFDYPWQDFSGNRTVELKQGMLEAYRHRGFFYPPYDAGKNIFVLNTEELATLYHFPGRVSETPTFARIEAKKSEPPVNLPI